MKKRITIIIWCSLFSLIAIGGQCEEAGAFEGSDWRTRKELRDLRKEYYSAYSHWTLGGDVGLPFFSGDVNSLSDGKTYFGVQGTIYAGYQFNPYLGLKLSASYGYNRAGARSYSEDYIITPDGMTYYPPTTITGVEYDDIYSRIRVFSMGLHMGINMNHLFVRNSGQRVLTVILEPAVYMQKYWPEIRMKDGGGDAGVKVSNSINLGLGGDLLLRFRVSRLIDLQTGGGAVYILNNNFDGIRTEARAYDSYSWNVKAGIVFKLNGKKHKDNVLYAGDPYYSLMACMLRDVEGKLSRTNAELDLLKAVEPEVVTEKRVVETVVEKEVIVEIPREIVREVVKEVVRENIVFPNVYFSRGSTTLNPQSYAKELHEMMSILDAHPDMRVIAQGFADHTGSDEVNNKVSYARAQSLRNYLIKAGVSPGRIALAGYGKDEETTGANSYSLLARRATLVIDNNL